MNHKEIWSVSRGRDFEEDAEVYYLLARNTLSTELENKISLLAVDIYRETKTYYDIWPHTLVEPNNIVQYLQLGEIIFSKKPEIYK